jgi:hypothetical protein
VITLKEYVILLSLKPAVRLDPQLDNILLNFEVKEPKKIMISKIQETISGSKIQSGLSLRVFLRAENLKEAVNCQVDNISRHQFVCVNHRLLSRGALKKWRRIRDS